MDLKELEYQPDDDRREDGPNAEMLLVLVKLLLPRAKRIHRDLEAVIQKSKRHDSLVQKNRRRGRGAKSGSTRWWLNKNYPANWVERSHINIARELLRDTSYEKMRRDGLTKGRQYNPVLSELAIAVKDVQASEKEYRRLHKKIPRR